MTRTRYGPFSAIALLALVLAMATTASARDNRNTDRITGQPPLIMVAKNQNTTATIATTTATADPAGIVANANNLNPTLGVENSEVQVNAASSAVVINITMRGANTGENHDDHAATNLVATNGGTNTAKSSNGTETRLGVGFIMKSNPTAQALFVSFVAQRLNC